MAQRITITPEKALEHLDEIAAKYQGTRDDHTVLSTSVAILQQVVAQWRKFSEEKVKGEKAKEAETAVARTEVQLSSEEPPPST